MSSRILILRSNPVAPDPRVDKIAHALTGAGYPVAIIGWDRTGELPVEELVGDARLHRLPIKANYGRGLGNLPNLLRWQTGLLGWLSQHRESFDLIHACDFDTLLPALWCKRRWGKKLVYDIFDFYADHLRNTPEPLKKLIRRIDLWGIGQTDAVILADDSRTVQIAGSYPRRQAVIYNSPEDVLPNLGQGSPAPPRGNLHLAYVGLLQVERGILELLDVLGRHPEWTLDMAGFGGDEDVILPQMEKLPNITWHGRIPYDQALDLYAEADVLFATYDPAIPNHRYSSPNKVFEAMMLSKPIIVAQDTNMDCIINESNSGLVVPYGDVDELEAALVRLQRDPALRARLGESGRQAYEQVYGWDIMAQRLLALYQAVEAEAAPPGTS
jgi:glycosyltransferase involved in cell wall biosynthesis